MIEKIDHLGIAVENLDEAAKLYTDALGLSMAEIEELPEQKVRIVMIPVGESRIELLEATDPESVIAKFIEKRGEGLHHVALGVSDIQKVLDELKAKGIRLIDETPRIGVGGAKIAFLHPKSTNGILLELFERE